MMISWSITALVVLLLLRVAPFPYAYVVSSVFVIIFRYLFRSFFFALKFALFRKFATYYVLFRILFLSVSFLFCWVWFSLVSSLLLSHVSSFFVSMSVLFFIIIIPPRRERERKKRKTSFTEHSLQVQTAFSESVLRFFQ